MLRRHRRWAVRRDRTGRNGHKPLGMSHRRQTPGMTPPTRTDRLHSWEATTALPLIAAAVVFLFVLTVPVIDPNLTGLPRQVLQVSDISIWLLFAVDYTIRMSLAPARLTPIEPKMFWINCLMI